MACRSPGGCARLWRAVPRTGAFILSKGRRPTLPVLPRTPRPLRASLEAPSKTWHQQPLPWVRARALETPIVAFSIKVCWFEGCLVLKSPTKFSMLIPYIRGSKDANSLSEAVLPYLYCTLTSLTPHNSLSIRWPHDMTAAQASLHPWKNVFGGISSGICFGHEMTPSLCVEQTNESKNCRRKQSLH